MIMPKWQNLFLLCTEVNSITTPNKVTVSQRTGSFYNFLLGVKSSNPLKVPHPERGFPASPYVTIQSPLQSDISITHPCLIIKQKGAIVAFAFQYLCFASEMLYCSACDLSSSFLSTSSCLSFHHAIVAEPDFSGTCKGSLNPNSSASCPSVRPPDTVLAL